MKIVAISGGFDPIHIGHIRYIREASRLGDFLVVIVNTDEFLIRKKGRAFMPLVERLEIVRSIKGVEEAIACIDDDQTVCRTLELIKPHIFAKGGDRTLENIPEREVCERLGIKMLFGVGGGKIQSSSELINRSKDEKDSD